MVTPEKEQTPSTNQPPSGGQGESSNTPLPIPSTWPTVNTSGSAEVSKSEIFEPDDKPFTTSTDSE